MRRSYCAWLIYSAVLILLSGFTKYDIKADKELVETAHSLAKTQVGVVEIAENDSPNIKEYLKSVGLGPGFSYCAAGIYWSFSKVNKTLEKEIPLPKTAVANRVFNFAKASGNRVKYKPKKYDLLIWQKHNSWQGHIEWISKVQKAGWVETIGFNTSKAGKEGVYMQRRNIYHPLGRLKSRGLVGFDFN